MKTKVANEAANVNVEELAVKIRGELAAAETAGRTALDHGIVAGKLCLQAHDRIGRGFRGWLEQNALKKSSCYDFMKLAKNEESVRSAGHSSIAAALRMLRAKGGKRSESKSRTDSGQPAAVTSSLNETITKAIRQALSLQKAATPKDVRAAGVAAALNAVNNKLASAGLDLNDITIGLNQTTAHRKAA